MAASLISNLRLQNQLSLLRESRAGLPISARGYAKPPRCEYLLCQDYKFPHITLLQITLSGGVSNVKRVYHNMCKIAQGQTGVNTAERSNTSLMQLCSTTFKDEMDPTRYAKAQSLGLLIIRNPLLKLVGNFQEGKAKFFLRSNLRHHQAVRDP